MPKDRRHEIIKKIEKERKSRLICYVTSTRKGLDVQMAMDAVRRIYDHLTPISGVDKIDLFIHSNGGDGTVPWRLVTLIREFTESFGVLVPHRAFSAATLTALGADEILMHQMGMLGPTDATVGNPFNPRDPLGRQLGISVEDVTAYLALLKDDAGIRHEDELIQGFNILASNVHPLALGNVKRSISQSRMMAKKLLSLHLDPSKDEHLIEELVDNLTSKLYFHGHPINRKEAKDIGIPTIVEPSSNLEKAMWDLYLDYEAEMKLEKSFEMTDEFLAAFPKQQPNTAPEITNAADAKVTYIESLARTDVAYLSYQLVGQTGQNGITNVTLIVRERGWRTE